MRVAIGADHAGFRLKQAVSEHLSTRGHEPVDLGTDSEDPVDYPPFCVAVARAVARGSADRGVVIGGSGQGEAMVANKVPGVRAALCLGEFTARLARSHNDANVLALGGRIVAEGLALSIVDLFLSTPFDGGRHVRRLAQITEIEAEEARALVERRASEPVPREPGSSGEGTL
ncbi:MAG: ribose 5-phosphate isomerase B [Acidimicrobiia bacterium]